MILNKRKDLEEKLEERYFFLKEFYPQYNILFLAHQGSYNYGLEIEAEEYHSDFDVKAIAIPSFDNLINNTVISDLIIYKDNSHIDVKDLRHINDLLFKGNIQYLELLFTDYCYIPKEYKEDFELYINSIKNHLIEDNILKISKCALGMALEKRKALCHRYEGLKEKIDKYGYDGKQLHHIVRLYFFLNNLLKNDFRDYQKALVTFDDEQRKLLNKAKLNEFSLNTAISLAEYYLDMIRKLNEKVSINYIEKEVSRKYIKESVMREAEKYFIKNALKKELLND